MEQVASADVYVFYDDVQFSKGSFTNRVQIRQRSGTQWLTVPLKKHPLSSQIREVAVVDAPELAVRHTQIFQDTYHKAPYCEEALQLLRSAFTDHDDSLAGVSAGSTVALAEYLGLSGVHFVSSSTLSISGSSWERVLRICQFFKATDYITGHGAMNYLDHEAFDAAGIQVLYADYSLSEYPQIGEGFTPYVSALDLVAMTGREARAFIRPRLVPWREFMVRWSKEAAPR